jgi:ATP-binding cassette, subfamily B, bacterial
MPSFGLTKAAVFWKSSMSGSEKNDLKLATRIKISLRLLRISWQLRPGIFVLFFVGAFLEVGASILTIYASAQIAAILAQFIATGNSENVWLWLWVDIAAISTIALGFAVMAYAQRIIYMVFSHWATVQYQSALCRIDLPDFYDEKVRNELNKVSGGYTWQISQLSSANFDLIYGLIRFMAITLVVSQITWWIVPLIALFLVPSLIAESKVAKLMWFVWDTKGDERHIFWGFEWILRQPKGQMELRSTQAGQFASKKIDVMLGKFYQEQESKYKTSTKVTVPTKILEVAGTAIGSIVLLKQVLGKAISLDRYFFLSGALLRIGGALNNIFGTLARMQDLLLFANSYFNIIDKSPVNHDVANPVDVSNAKNLDIVFDNVTFSYPGQELPVFEKLNLQIKSGEHVALVGENGAGKSTLIKLLMRFYKPDSGRILINGVGLNDIAIESWYSQLATLFQDFNQYPLPISENIEIGRSNQRVDKSLLKKAATFGGVDELVQKYKHGWDTVLDASFKKGVEPSGGQWQRIALARAFYRQANVIVLDEPTSAIDANAEYNIFNAIFKHYQDKTAIIVSHRFSTVRRANRIIVIDNGKIVEQGSHQELMKKGGMYHDLFSKQAEGYK